MEKSIPLESRGVRVLTKCSRRHIGVVATQTIVKVDKRPGKHISYNIGLMRSNGVIPTSIIQSGLKINLLAPRTTNNQWQQRGP